ncbi:MAG TPA: SpvB/TcaC N-terminal domain-containing protein, partial [Kofleriaceae bacterium]
MSPPAIALPKGGGAIRGIGEKFSANPVTGTGAMSVPIFTSPGRSGFGPRLALSYDSGAGNGPFGFGWTLGLPAITRKTEKGLPLYRDGEDSDVFILSGAEDLVPALDDAGEIVEQVRDGYRVRRYRPRIEGLFARIERWSRPGDVHWRSIARDNTTTVYGRTEDSRIADPADPARIFSWLVCESYDGKGNAIAFSYAREDAAGIDITQAHERNRGDARGTARYLSGIRYGNVEPQVSPADPAPTTWMFEVVVDYDADHVEPVSHSSLRASLTAGSAWRVRPDPFSSYRSGFEVRTYRRCRRVLMFHRIPELGAEPQLVRSTDFEHDDLDYRTSPGVETELAHPGSSRTGSFLRRIAQLGYLVDAARQPVVRGAARYLTYTTRSLPPIELEYSRATIRDAVRELDPASLENLPAGIDGAHTQWVDLDGEGLSGALTEQGGAWFYKRNVAAIGASVAVPHLAPVERLPTLPTPAALSGGGQQLVDVSGDGRLDVVRFGGGAPGYFERTADGGWESFRPFDAIPNAAFEDPGLRLVDLTGDGLADLLIGHGGAFTWYPSLGASGFAAAESVPQPADEELGPRVVFADASQSIHLADMSGDGLNDIVRVRNGEVCYWPSLGYGRFGRKVTMDRSPWFDAPDRFDHRRVRLADIDGSGTIDIIYLGAERVALYFNQSGNGFTAARTLAPVPRYDDLSSVTTADLLGNGTACLVWSSSLAREQGRAVRYVDLMGGNKPNLLVGVDNKLGARARITYAPSTKFYLA